MSALGRVSAQGCVCVYLGGGRVCPGGYLPGGCLPGGVSVSAWVVGLSAQAGVSVWEGCVYPSMHWGKHPPPVNTINDACENITFLQLLLRLVKKQRIQKLLGCISD